MSELIRKSRNSRRSSGDQVGAPLPRRLHDSPPLPAERGLRPRGLLLELVARLAREVPAHRVVQIGPFFDRREPPRCQPAQRQRPRVVGIVVGEAQRERSTSGSRSPSAPPWKRASGSDAGSTAAAARRGTLASPRSVARHLREHVPAGTARQGHVVARAAAGEQVQPHVASFNSPSRHASFAQTPRGGRYGALHRLPQGRRKV